MSTNAHEKGIFLFFGGVVVVILRERKIFLLLLWKEKPHTSTLQDPLLDARGFTLTLSFGTRTIQTQDVLFF
jgi:hypothetical protein